MKDNIALKIFNVFLVIVTVIMGFVCCVLLYYKTIGKNKIPSAVTSTYATFVTDPQTGEKKPAIEANYYSNYNGTGYEVVELLFNCYSGFSKQAIYSRGFQLVKDKQGNIIPYEFKEEKDNVYQYNKYTSQGFETGHQYKWGDPMFIDIDGRTYAVKLDGKYVVTTKGFSFKKSAPNFFKALFTDWGMFGREENWNKYTNYEYNYTFEDLLEKIAKIIKSFSEGTGDSIIPLIDLGDFLHIYPLDDDGKVAGEPLGVNTLINSYYTMSVHYDKRGMVWAEQSMFKSVAGDSNFNISGVDTEVDYWQARVQYNLTEQDFEKRYLSAENGYYFYLSTEKLNEIKNFDSIEIDINFDVSKLGNINCLGFDYYALYGIKVKSLTISSDIAREFKLLAGSLKDTGLTLIQTKNITIRNINSGVELWIWNGITTWYVLWLLF